MKRTKAIAVTVMIALAVITFAAAALVMTVPFRASASGTVTAADPDSDIVTYRGEAYAAAEFIRSVARSEASVQSASVTQDDPIVGMIPKEKFTTENSSLEIGDEWGYYIMTEKDTMDVDGDSYLRSYVTTFDISETRNSANGTIDLSVSVESQDMYITLIGSSCSARIPLAEHDFNSYDIVNYTRTGSSPLVVRYGENPRFYLRDMSFAMSLYNENELNYGDSGYMASDDLGSYFVNLDYGYDGSVWQKDGVDVGSDIIEPVADLLIDIFLGQVLKIEPLRTILEIGGYIYDGIKIVNDVIEAETEYVVDENKEITCTAYSANRDDQIAHYGNVIRSAAITVNAQEDKQLWYGTGDHAEARFQIGHSALNDEADWYTRILKEAAFSVVDIKDGSYVASGVDTSTGYLRSPVYKELSLGAEEQGYVLENGKDFFTYTPEYDGRYVLDITGGAGYNETNASVSVTDESGDIVSRQNGGIYELEADETYKIQVSHSGTGARFGVSLDAETLPSSIAIGAGKTVLVSLGYIDGEVSTLSTGSSDVVIDGIYRLSGGELDLLEEYGDTSNVTYAWDSEQHGNYYVTLKNTSSSSRTAQLTMADIPSVSVGSDGSAETTVTFDGEHYSYIRFTDLPAGNYVVTVEDDAGTLFSVYDSSMDMIPSTYGSGIAFFSIDNQTIIYIAINSHFTGVYSCVLNSSETAYQWVIDENVCSENTIKIPQGDRVELSLLVNGEVYNGRYEVIGDKERYLVEVFNNQEIYVGSNSCADGGYITIIAQIILDDIFIPKLMVIPTIKHPFEGITVDAISDQNYITIAWENVNNLDSFILTIPGTSFSTTITVAEYPDSKYTIWANSMPSNMPVVTFAIKEVYYNWAKVGKSLVNTDLTYTFDYYFGGGSGTYSDMYVIDNARHFHNMGILTGSNIYYSLSGNITVPSHLSNIKFYGKFYGNSHTITWEFWWSYDDTYEEDKYGNGYYAVPPYQGLFAENSGTVRDLRVSVDLSAEPTFDINKREYAGGIVGHNSGSVIDCSVTGSIDSNMNRLVLGGIVGYNTGTVDGCNNLSCTIRGAYVIGGLVGENDGTVSDGRVNRVDFTLHNAPYWNSANADINAIGGIAGINDSRVTNCHVGSDSDGGYLRFEDMDAQTRPYAGEVIGAQKRTGASMTNCVDSGMAILDSDLTSAQRKNINKAGGGLIGNTY